MRTLEQLKREGSIALWHDYELGHANDLSGNGNDGTISGADGQFTRNGFVNSYYGAGYISVPHSASINLTTLTIVALILGKRITQYQTAARLCAKGPVGTRAFDISENAPSAAIGVTVDGGTSSTWFLSGLANHHGISYLGLAISSGATSPLYIDGLFNTNAGPNPVLTTNNSPLYIGNLQGLSRGYGRTISAFLIFNKLLSASEHAQVYGELMKTRRGVLS